VPPETNSEGAGPADRMLAITRVFDAPREVVFDAFTDPQRLLKWWGPHGCQVIACETDPRPGGTWSISMRSPRVMPRFTRRYAISPKRGRTPSQQDQGENDSLTGETDWIVERQRGVYREVTRPERLVFTYTFEDEVGRALHQTVVAISFADEGGRTRLTLNQAVFEDVASRDDHVRGWTEALDHLTDYLAQV
jgi:uncharacterized protein YndB with AHSA1/START domain